MVNNIYGKINYNENSIKKSEIVGVDDNFK
jgi:hypothetical protein